LPISPSSSQIQIPNQFLHLPRTPPARKRSLWKKSTTWPPFFKSKGRSSTTTSTWMRYPIWLSFSRRHQRSTTRWPFSKERILLDLYLVMTPSTLTKSSIWSTFLKPLKQRSLERRGSVPKNRVRLLIWPSYFIKPRLSLRK
jgi:hypothetical protein